MTQTETTTTGSQRAAVRLAAKIAQHPPITLGYSRQFQRSSQRIAAKQLASEHRVRDFRLAKQAMRDRKRLRAEAAKAVQS